MDPNFQGMKDGIPFLITGLGASGTRWLAKHLGSSLCWTVKHEPDDPYYNQPRVYTGSVDSTVRHTKIVESYLDDGRLAVVVRDPRDIAAHCVRKGTWGRVQHEIARDVKRLVDLLERGAHPIYFNWITTNRMNLQEVEHWAGIFDIPFSHTVPRIGHAKRGGPARSVQIAARNEVWRHPVIRSYTDKWFQGC
jgi:hypothetical protein